MPKVAYSEEERKQIRQSLIAAGLDLMSKQGIQHTTVEQIYKKSGYLSYFLLFFFPCQGGSHRRSAVSAAAQDNRICQEPDEGSFLNLAAGSQTISQFVLLR